MLLHNITQRNWLFWDRMKKFWRKLSCIRFVCFRFCRLCSNLESVKNGLWGKQHYDVIPFSKIFKTACCTVWHLLGNANVKISQCSAVDPRVIKRIRKELDEFNGDYEGTAARKPQSASSLKKEFSNLGYDWQRSQCKIVRDSSWL